MTRRLAALSVAVTVVASTSVVFGADRWVPGEYPTIQAAIDDCNNGDVVIVEPNIYTGTGNKNLDFGGKAITVRSIDPEDPCVVAATVIDCENNGRGFYFHSGEGANSVLSGFTIMRGVASKGGGVCCSGSSPTLKNCIITGNYASAAWDAYGGGIYCTSGSSPAIINCTISNNTVEGGGEPDIGTGGGPARGGGIYCSSDSHPTLENCKILSNTARGGINNGGRVPLYGGDAYGGGVYGDLTIKSCIVSGNIAWGGSGDSGFGCTGGWAYGGGIYGRVTVSESTISYNSAEGGYSRSFSDVDGGNAYGGGIYCRLGGESTLESCAVVGNTASGGNLGSGYIGSHGGSAFGGGVYCSSAASVNNCTTSKNAAIKGSGYGIGGQPGTSGGGGVGTSGTTVVTNCILWANTASEAPQVSGSGSVSYSDVEGGYSGEGNINADPMFADAGSDDYHLQPLSPCIDSGDPNYTGEPNGTDVDGNPRIVCGVVDMGAYEFQGILYVDDDAPSDPPPGEPRGTEAHPFDDIQEAIDLAKDGYTVRVCPGLYLEPDPLYPETLYFYGKNIRVTGLDPTDSNIVSSTVIRGIVQFDGTEDPNCALTGFTIRDLAHGRIYGNHTHATISHCIMSGNAPCWATVIENCHGTISNCVITDNFTIYLCGVEPVVLDCHGLIKNCTIANNSSEIGVFAGGTTTLENCIIYCNGDQVEFEPQIRVGSGATLNIAYCDLQGHVIGISGGGSATINIGPGIIDADPCFVRPGSWDFNAVPDGLVEGDYHLKSAGWRWDPNETCWTYDDVSSRCIDAGNPGAPLGDELMKVLPQDPNNDFGVNLRVNMGAYGGTAEASMALPGSVLLADLNNDGIVDTPDLGWQLADWLQSESEREQPGDLNRDGFVDMVDYAMLAGAWMWSTDWADRPP